MKAIILCAGKGTRLKPLTDTIPKTLLQVHNKPILEHILNELPDEITEVFLVIDYLGEKIKAFVKNTKFPFPVTCVQQISEYKGTAAALLSVQKYIQAQERFLVLNGDDLIKKYDLEKMLAYPRSFQVQHAILPGHHKIVSHNGLLHAFEAQSPEEQKNGALIATGSYVLDKNFFNFEAVQIYGGEIGIPQTLLKYKNHYPVQTVECTSWQPINTREHLEKANEKQP